MSNLIKIADVSSRYDVTTRTLRYYEDMGLITSVRSDDVAYRMYDTTAINRLEQILILRKLNIGIKDIQRIFNAAGSEVVLEVLNKKIENIDDEVALLHELKNIVLDFIREIEQVNFADQSDIKLLYDKAKEIETQFTNVDYIGKPNKTSVQAVTQISNSGNIERLLEVTDKLDKKIPDVIVIRVPNFRAITSAKCAKWSELMDWAWKENRHKRLFKTIVFDCFDFLVRRKDDRSEYVMAINDDVTEFDTAPFEIIEFIGGWYAISVSRDGDHESVGKVESKIRRWIEDTDFQFDESRAVMGGYAYNNNSLKVRIGYEQLVRYIPIKLNEEKLKKIEDEKRAVEEKRKADEPIITERLRPVVEATERTMSRRVVDDEVNIVDDGITTTEQFTGAIKIKIRALIEGYNIRITHRHGAVVLNRKDNDVINDKMFVRDLHKGIATELSASGSLPIGEVADIEWIIGEKIFAIRINGELRHAGDHYMYINNFTNLIADPMPVRIMPSTAIKVELLQITELGEESK